MIKTIQKSIAATLAAVTALTACCTLTVGAASGKVFSCKLNRCYEHPVTKEIEDSGGRNAYATGQGMVEGCTSDFAMMEESDSGDYYLTIRMSLMDYTSGHSFTVQEWGASGWSDTGAAITQNGSDENGATADICIQVPAENAIVRGTMYVEPMGRWVIWYMYASDFTEGNTTGMIPTMVTETAAQATQPATTAPQETTAAPTTAPATTVPPTTEPTTVEATTIAAEDVIPKADGAVLDNKKGLSLSTEKEVGDLSENSSKGNNLLLLWILLGCAAVGACAAVIVIVKKKKAKSKLNTEDDHEEYDEDGDDNA